MDSVKRLKEEFSIAIRRQKKQEIFRAYRNKLRIEMIEQQQSKMTNFLDNAEKRQDWIHRKARQIAGIPNPSWRYILNDLFSSLMCFKEKGSFHIWISTQIIKNVCLLFEQEYHDLRLASEAAKLLGSVVYYQEQEEDEKASSVAREILEQDILRNLILQSEDTTLPHQEISHFMTLIGNLAIYDLVPVIKNGGFIAFSEWSLRILREKKINRAYLEQIYSFFRFFAQKINKISINRSVSLQILSLMNEFSQIQQSVHLLSLMIHIVSTIIESMPKDSIYKPLVNLKPLTKKIFELATHENQTIRISAWGILGRLSSGNQDNLHIFQENNFMKVISIAYQYEPKDNRNFDRITSNILSCMSNLMCEGDAIREIIIFSPLINIAIDSTHPERSTCVKKDAFYCLGTAISTQNYNLLNRIIYQLPILQKLVFGLQSMLQIDKPTVKDIIITLYALIKLDNNVFRTQGNRILNILQSKYCFSNVLTQVLEKYHTDAMLNQTINTIFDLFSC